MLNTQPALIYLPKKTQCNNYEKNIDAIVVLAKIWD